MPLGYLRDGRLFQFEVKPKFANSGELSKDQGPSATERLVRKVSHFWLCGKCASTLTLAFDALKGVVVQQRPTA
jgi:hypothetical protein